MKNNFNVVSAAIVGLGIAIGGWFVGDGFLQGRASDRFVTVKGVSERDVLANIALWPIRFVSTDDDLTKAQADIKKSKDLVMAFLQKYGFDDEHKDVI